MTTEKEKLEAAIVKAARESVEHAVFDLERQRRKTAEAQERADRLERETQAQQDACAELKREQIKLLTEIDQLRHETLLSDLRSKAIEDKIRTAQRVDLENSREWLIDKLTSLFGWVSKKAS